MRSRCEKGKKEGLDGGEWRWVVESVRPPRDNAPSSVIATINLTPIGVMECGTSTRRLRVGGPQVHPTSRLQPSPSVHT